MNEVTVTYYRNRVLYAREFKPLDAAKRWVKQQIDECFEFCSPTRIFDNDSILWEQGDMTIQEYIKSIRRFIKLSKHENRMAAVPRTKRRSE